MVSNHFSGHNTWHDATVPPPPKISVERHHAAPPPPPLLTLDDSYVPPPPKITIELSPSPPPAPSHTGGGSTAFGDMSLSVEETNRIRAKLGLKPLQVGNSCCSGVLDLTFR